VSGAASACFLAHDVLDLHQEPGSTPSVRASSASVQTGAKTVGEVPQPRSAGADISRAGFERGLVRPVHECGSKPAEPTSRPRIAFCSDSWNVRPIAITSPTDFICVVRRVSAVANFSKVKRGTLVTT
jgi:hypothetical protein